MRENANENQMVAFYEARMCTMKHHSFVRDERAANMANLVSFQ